MLGPSSGPNCVAAHPSSSAADALHSIGNASDMNSVPIDSGVGGWCGCSYYSGCRGFVMVERASAVKIKPKEKRRMEQTGVARL